MVKALSPEEEDRRRLCRERKTLIAERVEHVNRIKGLLVAQGICDYEPLHRDRRTKLGQLKTGHGRPLPSHLKSQVGRELDRLELILEQIKAVERERDALFATPEENTESRSSPAAILMTLKGIGTEFAPLFCPLASGREPLFQPLDYYGV